MINKNTKRLTSNIDYCEIYCETNKARCPIYSSCINRKSYEKAKEYEDAEEQGLLIKLPCKVGSTVYSVVKDGLQIFELKFSLDFYVRRMSDFGKTIFLTKEEAEQVLAELKGV